MLLLICIIVLLVCIISLFKILKNKKIIVKHKKIILTLFSIIILLITIFIIIKIILPIIPHNTVSKEDRILLEKYILDNYGLELTVTESEIIHRGNIGINPGIEYVFVLKNSMNFEYRLNINEYYEVDLKSILAENPELNLMQMK